MYKLKLHDQLDADLIVLFLYFYVLVLCMEQYLCTHLSAETKDYKSLLSILGIPYIQLCKYEPSL